jgi:hypothetical protein
MPALKKSVFAVKLLLPLLFTPFSYSVWGQTVFSADSKYDADVKVYVAASKYEADLVVYKYTAKYEATDNKGWWFFTSSKYDAKKKIYFCDSKYEADLIIWFTDSKYDAGWRSNAKKSLMY